MYGIIFYVMVCLIVGMLGANRKFGFWAYVFAAALFTPLVGIILVFASDKRPKPRYSPHRRTHHAS